MNDWKPRVGDKVRVLVDRSQYGGSIRTDVAHRVNFLFSDGEVSLKATHEVYGGGYRVVLPHQIEPWRDEPPTLAEQLAAKREERESRWSGYVNAIRTADHNARAVEVLDDEIRDLESQLAAETAKTRLAEIEAQKAALVEEESRLRALVTPKIEVGAIVDADTRFGTYRGRVVKELDGRAEVELGDMSRTIVSHCDLRLIFPANHAVAQSLASRKDGEWREGDVVKLGGTHGRRGETVVLGKWIGWSDEYEAQQDAFGIGGTYVFKPGAPYVKYSSLVTPRELHVDIGDASGGEWQRWFTVDGEEVAA